MRIGATLAAVVLVLAACGDSASSTTSGGPEIVTGATAGPPTTTTVPVTSTEPPRETTAAPPTTTSTPATGDPVFSITSVTFGSNGFVQITNTGGGPGTLAGHWLCQRPSYFELEPVDLDAGESIWVAAGDGAGLDITAMPLIADLYAAGGQLGELTRTGGEVALYSSRQFTIADDIRDFVAWSEPGGLPGLGRAGVAVAAGIWPSSGLVEVPTDGISITVTALPATGPDAWVADSGG